MEANNADNINDVNIIYWEKFQKPKLHPLQNFSGLNKYLFRKIYTSMEFEKNSFLNRYNAKQFVSFEIFYSKIFNILKKVSV